MYTSIVWRDVSTSALVRNGIKEPLDREDSTLFDFSSIKGDVLLSEVDETCRV